MVKKITLLAIALTVGLAGFTQKPKPKDKPATEAKVKLTSASLGKMEARHIGPAALMPIRVYYT